MKPTTANSFMIRQWVKEMPSDRVGIKIVELFETVENSRNQTKAENEKLKARIEGARNVLEPEVFHKDGGLYSLGWYLSWDVGQEHAVLDGPFTADELIAIGSYMKETNEPRTEVTP